MFIPVVAACCIVDGLVLLQGRQMEKRNQDFLNFPGGKIERFEALEAALLREIREELGSTVTSWKLIHSRINRYGPGPQEPDYLVLFYQVTLSEYPRWQDLQGNVLHWVGVDQVPKMKNLLPGTLEALELCLKN